MSAFQICHGGNSTFFNSFDKTKFSCFTLSPTQHDSFFRNYKFEFLFSLVKINFFFPIQLLLTCLWILIKILGFKWEGIATHYQR